MVFTIYFQNKDFPLAPDHCNVTFYELSVINPLYSFFMRWNDVDPQRWAKPDLEIKEEPVFLKTEPIEASEEKHDKVCS